MRTGAALALSLVLTAALSSVAAAPDPARDGFDAAEEAHLRVAASEEPSAVRALADFYAGHELWPEALAALARLKAPDAGARRLAVEAAYRLGRHRMVVEQTSVDPSLRAYRALSLTRLGAYAEAAAGFEGTSAPDGLLADFHLSAAEARVFSGDASGAGSDLDAAARIGVVGADETRLHFLRAQVHLAAGAAKAGRGELRRAAKGPPDEWSMRARLALAQSAEALEAMRLSWRSPAFDRDRLTAEGSARLARGEFEQGFAALARVAYDYPESDAALRAAAKIGAGLAALFDSADLPLEGSARVFFDHVEFAPPGAEGDALIRQAADRLTALGLYREAAMLLDHQVFKRLRGAERARVAADLADLQLAANAPDAALAALRSTRIAGLDAQTNARRLRLEATALARSGKRDNALALLANAADPQALTLRASIYWDGERWADAARDYAAAFAAAGPARDDRVSAVRAATAYLLAGDRAGYRAFVASAAAQLEGTAEEKLIRSLGDIDRDAFLATFMENYRALFAGAAGQEG